jgi:hypothetical protein
LDDLRDIRDAMLESAPRAAAAADVADGLGDGVEWTTVAGKAADGEVRPLVGGDSV